MASPIAIESIPWLARSTLICDLNTDTFCRKHTTVSVKQNIVYSLLASTPHVTHVNRLTFDLPGSCVCRVQTDQVNRS